MAHVKLAPIGSPRDAFLDARAFEETRDALAQLEARIEHHRAKARAGWGPKYEERVHEKGKLTARERIEALVDPGTRLFEVGTLVNDSLTFGELTSPGAGVVTAPPVTNTRTS